ncbi:ribonuclease H-like protein, partial [Neolentinus lepideus HHB14362 ss-1]
EALPLYTYKDYDPKPCVVYIRNEDEANDFIQLLKGPLGFDMEWCFVRGRMERRTALVQFSDEKMILLVQEVIESPDVLKIGANIAGDGKKLYRDFGILPKSLLELGALAQKADNNFKQRKICALAKTVALYEKKTLSKGPVRSSNWEAELSEEQKEYAASDAHCALMVYKRLMKLADLEKRIVIPKELSTDITLPPVPPTLPDRTDNVSTASISTASTSGTDVSSTTALPNDSDFRQFTSPQWLRAYNLWHHSQRPLHEICARLRSPENPLKDSTVISYVIRALQADATLPYSMPRLKELVQLEAGSWQRHKGWIRQQENQAASHHGDA